MVVTSIAWDTTNTDHSVSQSILVGSSKGQLFECVLDASDKAITKVLGGKSCFGFGFF